MAYSGNSQNEIGQFAKNYPFLLAALIASAISYMIARVDVFFLIYNLSLLFFAGRLLIDHASGKRFLHVFLLSLFASAGFYILVFGYHQQDMMTTMVMSFAGAAIAILIATAILIPNYSLRLLIFGSISLKYVALILAGIQILTINPKAPDESVAGIGGILIAGIYIYLFKYRLIISKKAKSFLRRKPKLAYRNPNPVSGKRPLSDDEYNHNKVLEQKEIDKILDKIKLNGYDTLTKQEKEKLFNASRK
jgi:membrane associated rhomboid family serine protease